MRFLYGKDVLITGASSGIGAECARLFAESGHRVFACARSLRRGGETFESGGEIIPVILDVCSEDSVKSAIGSILAQTVDIGTVVHCAGAGIAGAAEDTPDEAAHRQMEVNFFGVLRVNRHILPFMRKRGSGLVLIVSSVAGVFPIPFQSHYSSSKSALEAYAGALRMELSRFGIKVAVVAPGDTKTAFTDARRYEIPPGSPYDQLCRRSVSKMERDERRGRSPRAAARDLFSLSRSKNPPFRRVVGTEYKFLVFLRRLLPERLILLLLKRMYLG